MDNEISFIDFLNLNNKESEKLLAILANKDKEKSLEEVTKNGSIFEFKPKKLSIPSSDREQPPSKLISPVFSTYDMPEETATHTNGQTCFMNGESQGEFINANDSYCGKDKVMNHQYEETYSSMPYQMANINPMLTGGPQQNNLYHLPHYDYGDYLPRMNYPQNAMYPPLIYHTPENNANRPYMANHHEDTARHDKNKNYGYHENIQTNTQVTNPEFLYNGNSSIPNNYASNYMCAYPMNQGFNPRAAPFIPSINMSTIPDRFSAPNYSHNFISPYANQEYYSSHSEIYPETTIYSNYTIPNVMNGFDGNVAEPLYTENISPPKNDIAEEIRQNPILEVVNEDANIVSQCEMLSISSKQNGFLEHHLNGAEEPDKHTQPLPVEQTTMPDTVPSEPLVSNGTDPLESTTETLNSLVQPNKVKKNRKKKRKSKFSLNGDSGSNTRSATPAPTVTEAVECHKEPIVTSQLPPPEVSITLSKEETNQTTTSAWGTKKSWSNVFGATNARTTQIVAATGSDDKYLESERTNDHDYKIKIAAMVNSFKKGHTHHQVLVRGLINKSVWCYTNCLLQALMACKPFLSMMQLFLKEIPELETLDRFPFLSSIGRFIGEYSEVSEVMKPSYKGKAKHSNAVEMGVPCEPACIYNLLLTTGSDLFEDGSQQDAQEALNFLLNGLHEEIAECLGVNGGPQPNAAEDGDDWHTKGPNRKSCVTRTTPYHQTPFSEIFWGEFRYTQTASGTSSANIQPFNTLLLDIQSSKVDTLAAAFDKLVSKEEISGYTCSKTKKETTVVEQVLLQTLPQVLILYLNRFDYGENGLLKDNKRVDFDIQLEIGKDMIYNAKRNRKGKQNDRTYTLFAVVKHEGPMATKGHYICEVNHGGNKWLRCDDSNIRSISVEDVRRYDRSLVPYLLFYQRNDTFETSHD